MSRCRPTARRHEQLHARARGPGRWRARAGLTAARRSRAVARAARRAPRRALGGRPALSRRSVRAPAVAVDRPGAAGSIDEPPRVGSVASTPAPTRPGAPHWPRAGRRIARGGRSGHAPRGARRPGVRRTRWRWISASSSTASGSCSRSATRQATHALDASYYDLLASEARLASFVAIAKNDVPVDHWFRLGRTLTHAAGETALVSWSGSMFEYLMPPLVMRSFPVTLLDQTYAGAVRAADRLRRRARRAVGRERERLQRPRPPPDLPVPRRSACPTSRSSAGSGATWSSRRTPRRSRRWSTRSARWPTSRRLEAKGALGPYGFRDAIDYTRPDAGQRVRRGPAPTWRTTSAWASSRSPTRWPARSGSGASTPTRSSARPSCCCTSGSRGGWCCSSRRQRELGRGAAGGRRTSGPPVRRARHARHAAAARRPARPPAVHHHGEPLRRRATAATRSSPSPAGAPTAPATPPGSSAT